MTGEGSTIPASEIKELRDHYNRGWVDEKTQEFIDDLDEILEATHE